MKKTPTIVLAGGGTGGHVIPAIALAETLVSRGCRVRFIGTRGRLEERLVPEAGFEIDYIDVRPLVGQRIAERAIGLMSVPFSVVTAMRLLRERLPDLVMGVGGYVAGPVVLAGALMRRPTALLEQNATLGMTNRLLKRWVDRAFVAYDSALAELPARTGLLTGNPVKPSIVAASKKRKKPRARGKLRLLVMGGSQGAAVIDERVPAAIAAAALQKKIFVRHQCSAARLPEVKGAYQSANIDAEVTPFIADTAAAYLETDLVIARSGATTVSELAVMGLPSILIPYPHHKDAQQAKNAAPLEAVGGAVVLNEKTTDASALAAALKAFADDRGHLRRAADAAATLGRPDAAKQIADTLLSLLWRA